MSVNSSCIFDPAIFDTAIFTTCSGGGPSPAGGAADTSSGNDAWKRRKQREDDELERSNIARKRRYDEWRIANEQSKKLAKKVIKPIIEKQDPPKKLIIPDKKLAEIAAKKVAQSVIYRIYQDAEKQKLAELIKKEKMLRDDEEAILLLLGD